ncbi:MAG: multicopper oxidase family protein [Candidatus Nanoarchaeia archaeon]
MKQQPNSTRINLLLLLASLFLLSACTSSMNDLPVGVQEAISSNIVDLSYNQVFELEASAIKKNINGNDFKLLAYNKQLPGPVLKVKQNSEVKVLFKNRLDAPTTVHWHGLRLENSNDGIPGVTQEPILPGEQKIYTLRFPDDGVYWYHTHIREDVQQELGMYGAILVTPEKETYNQVDQEEVLFIDDILLDQEEVAPFYDEADHALMGRFGNQMLTNFAPDYSLDVEEGKITRLYLINSANTRVFNFSLEGTSLKVVGGDSGLYEKDFWADSVILAPGERTIIEISFQQPGTYQLINRNPFKTYSLGKINVKESSSITSREFYDLKEHSEVIQSIDPFRKYVDTPPDVTVDLEMEMHGMQHGMMSGSMMNQESKEGIEWEDTFSMMNQRTTSETLTWILRDRETGKENEDLNYFVKEGEVKKIRIFNDPKSAHPMQHPIHLHGQRFLVLNENGISNNNLVWKDTVLVPAGSTIDILIPFTNLGTWVFHCHIAEHLEAGMMGQFTVSQ